MSQRSRIDLWLVSDRLADRTVSHAPLTDHACIGIEICKAFIDGQGIGN